MLTDTQGAQMQSKEKQNRKPSPPWPPFPQRTGEASSLEKGLLPLVHLGCLFLAVQGLLGRYKSQGFSLMNNSEKRLYLYFCYEQTTFS